MQGSCLSFNMRRLPRFLCIIVSICLMTDENVAASERIVEIGDLAGTYIKGEGRNGIAVLRLYADHSFTLDYQVTHLFELKPNFTFELDYHHQSPGHTPYHGKAVIEAGILKISDDKKGMMPWGEGWNYFPWEYYHIQWSGRMYLVPSWTPWDSVEFCNEVNGGTEPRHEADGWLLLRQDDWNMPVVGLPSVPLSLEKFILREPVNGKITEVIGKSDAWIDLGTKDGVFKQMRLSVRGHDGSIVGQATIIKVEENRCRIRDAWGDAQFAAGQRVSSRTRA